MLGEYDGIWKGEGEKLNNKSAAGVRREVDEPSESHFNRFCQPWILDRRSQCTEDSMDPEINTA